MRVKGLHSCNLTLWMVTNCLLKLFLDIQEIFKVDYFRWISMFGYLNCNTNQTNKPKMFCRHLYSGMPAICLLRMRFSRWPVLQSLTQTENGLPDPSPRLLLSCASPNKQQTAVTELYPFAWIFPQRRIIKSDFPALLSDVMPLWVWVNSRGLYKEKWMYLKCHPAAGAWLSYSPSAHVHGRGWYQISSSNLHRGRCRFFLDLAVANQDINPPVNRLVSYRTSDDCWRFEAAWAAIDDELVWCSRSNTDMVEYILQNVDTVESNQFLICVWLGDLEVFDVAKPWHKAKDSLAFRVWSYSTAHPQ